MATGTKLRLKIYLKKKATAFTGREG